MGVRGGVTKASGDGGRGGGYEVGGFCQRWSLSSPAALWRPLGSIWNSDTSVPPQRFGLNDWGGGSLNQGCFPGMTEYWARLEVGAQSESARKNELPIQRRAISTSSPRDLIGIQTGKPRIQGAARWGEEIATEFGMDMFTPLYLKWITTGPPPRWIK